MMATDFDTRAEEARAVLTQELNRMRGRLCTAIESFGLPHTQERSCVSIIKLLSYDTQRQVEMALRGHAGDLDDGTRENG